MMSSTLASQVEEFINGVGKVPRSAVYGRFDLVAKRAIDTALEGLGTARRLVVGAADVAPLRQARPAVEPMLDTPAAPLPEPKARSPQQGKRTTRDDILELFEPGRRVARREVYERLSHRSARFVDETLRRLSDEGVLTREAYRGYWLAEGPTPPSIFARDRVLAVFRPGERLHLRDVKARVPGMNRNTVQRSLADLRGEGRICSVAYRGYWLPESTWSEDHAS